jgi:hypothetical protein
MISTLACEYHGTVKEVSRLFYADAALQEELAAARMHGKALLQVQLFEHAVGGRTQQATTLAMWLSRQHLGHSSGGLDEQVEKHLAKIDAMPPAEKQKLVAGLKALKEASS